MEVLFFYFFLLLLWSSGVVDVGFRSLERWDRVEEGSGFLFTWEGKRVEEKGVSPVSSPMGFCREMEEKAGN